MGARLHPLDSPIQKVSVPDKTKRWHLAHMAIQPVILAAAADDQRFSAGADFTMRAARGGLCWLPYQPEGGEFEADWNGPI